MDEFLETFQQAYAGEDRIKVFAGHRHRSRAVQGSPDVHIGGFTIDARNPARGALVVVLDNLLKGAASQALQNLNLALGLDETCGNIHMKDLIWKKHDKGDRCRSRDHGISGR